MANLALLALLAITAIPDLCLGAGQPPQGECCHYKFGGVSRLHFYVCCNNCDENDGNPTCNRETYDAASNGQYCGACGVDQGNARIKGDAFDCGGCLGQTVVKAVCDWKYGEVGFGFCWMWSSCFEDLCRAVKRVGDWLFSLSAQNLRREIGPYCGDDRCDPGENHNSCPFDCCPEYNPDKCMRECRKCRPRCCGESSCCT